MVHVLLFDRHVLAGSPHGQAVPGVQPSLLHVHLHSYSMCRLHLDVSGDYLHGIHRWTNFDWCRWRWNPHRRHHHCPPDDKSREEGSVHRAGKLGNDSRCLSRCRDRGGVGAQNWLGNLPNPTSTILLSKTRQRRFDVDVPLLTLPQKPLFGIQAPLSLIAGFGLLAGIPANMAPKGNNFEHTTLREKFGRIDYSGALLLILTITLFLLGLSGPTIWATPLILSGIALPVFILNELYVAKDPVIPIAVLRSRGTLLSCLATVGFMMARWGVLFYTPVYALAVRGWKPAVAGSILIPTNLGFATGGLLAGVFHIRRDGSFYTHSVISMVLFPFTFLILAFISTANSPWGLYLLMVFSNGAIAGASLNYTLVHLLHLTLPDVHPVVISLLATFRGFAGSFGSAIGGGLFGRVLHKSLVDGFTNAGIEDHDNLIRRLQGSPATVPSLHGKEKVVAVSAYEDAMKSLFLGAVGLTVVVAMIQAGTGSRAPTKTYDQLADEEDVQGEEGLVAGS